MALLIRTYSGVHNKRSPNVKVVINSHIFVLNKCNDKARIS